MDSLEVKDSENAKKESKLTAFAKKYKIALIILLVLALLAMVYFIVAQVITQEREEKVMAYLDGKTFILETYSADILKKNYKLLSFKDGMVAVEEWLNFEKEPSGEIDQYTPCEVKASLSDDMIMILKKYDTGWSTVAWVALSDDGTVMNYTYSASDAKWKESTIEELDNQRMHYFCDGHSFSQIKETTPATCAHAGKQEQTCSKCGYVVVTSIPAKEHDYKNKVCTVCGAKKQPQKAYDVEPDTWYVYNGALYYQNCRIALATSVGQGRGMMVQYLAVCQDCHCVDEFSKLAGPEVNYEVKKIYYCSECGAQTLVRFKIG